MNERTPLKKEEVIKRFQNEVQSSGSRIPDIDFRQLIGISVFLKCLGDSRLVHTVYGDRELVEVQLLEDAGDLKAGEHFIWYK